MTANIPGSIPSFQSEPLGEALSYEAALPLAWTALPLPIDTLRLERHADDNLRVLAAVALLDEQRAGSTTDESSPLDAEIARLNQKLNLLIDLVGFLVNQNAPTPDSQRLQLSWQGVVFTGMQALGETGLLSLRLNRSVPQPLVWPARIVHADDSERHARFEPFSEALQAALERHVFLHHRRAVAGTRKSAGS